MFATFGFGMSEILVLLAVGLLLFGNRLPGLARSLGRTVVDLRKEVASLEDDIRSPLK
jgi:sec-independent protein translocase protein TatA